MHSQTSHTHTMPCYRHRQDLPRSSKLPVLNLLTGQKSTFSPCRGDSLHWFIWNLARPRGTWVRLAVQNFIPIGAREWERGPQSGKNFHFLVKSRPARANPWPISIIVRVLYAQLLCISVLHLMRFASQVTELLLRNRASVIYPKFFSAPCRKNCALDRKVIDTFVFL